MSKILDLPKSISLFKYSLLLYLIIQSLVTFGQGDFKQGFVELVDQRIIKGYVKSNNGISSNFSCVFKETIESEEIEFSPQNLKSYGYDSGKVFFSKKIELDNDTLQVFAEILIEGRASLFEVLQRFYLQKDTLFLELKNTTKEKESREYLGILNFSLSDCKEMSRFLKSKQSEKYWIDVVKSAIDLYNRCDKPQIKLPKLFQINFLPFIGANYSVTTFSPSADLFLKFYSTNKYYNQTPLIFGLDINISAPKISNTIYLSVGAWYTSTKVNFSSSTPTEFNELDFLSTEILIPVGLKWIFLNKTKLKGYINVRITKNIKVDERYKRTQEIDQNGNIYTYESSFSEAKSSPAWNIGIGCSYELHNIKLFVESNYLNKNSKIIFSDVGNQELSKVTKSGIVSLGIKF